MPIGQMFCQRVISPSSEAKYVEQRECARNGKTQYMMEKEKLLQRVVRVKEEN